MSQPAVEYCVCKILDKMLYDKYSEQYFCEDCSGIIGESIAEKLSEITPYEITKSQWEAEKDV